MDFLTFILGVEEALRRPLPGLAAQLKMSSMRKLHRLVKLSRPEHAIKSSVLLLLYPVKQDIKIVFIQRADYPGIHAGQIGLPGGKYEPADKDLVVTALRESQEEIGIIPKEVHMIGKLTDLFIPPSRFLVTPYVGFMHVKPDFVIDKEEIAGIIEINIRDLFHEQARQIRKFTIGIGIRFRFPAYVVDGTIIWGATAMIISEFKEIVDPLLRVP